MARSPLTLAASATAALPGIGDQQAQHLGIESLELRLVVRENADMRQAGMDGGHGVGSPVARGLNGHAGTGASPAPRAYPVRGFSTGGHRRSSTTINPIDGIAAKIHST